MIDMIWYRYLEIFTFYSVFLTLSLMPVNSLRTRNFVKKKRNKNKILDSTLEMADFFELHELANRSLGVQVQTQVLVFISKEKNR